MSILRNIAKYSAHFMKQGSAINQTEKKLKYLLMAN